MQIIVYQFILPGVANESLVLQSMQPMYLVKINLIFNTIVCKYIVIIRYKLLKKGNGIKQ